MKARKRIRTKPVKHTPVPTPTVWCNGEYADMAGGAICMGGTKDGQTQSKSPVSNESYRRGMRIVRR